MRYSLPALSVVLILAVAGQAQTPAQRPSAAANTQVFRFAGASLTEYAVLNAPFQCDEIQEVVKTAPSGATFTSLQQRAHMFRDSQGLLRREQAMFGGVQHLITIFDPAGGSEYVLDPDHTAAHRIAVKVAGAKPAIEVYQGRLQRLLAEPAGATARVSLGGQTMEGVYVEGMSYSTPLPAGLLGSDRAFLITQDRWVAPDLALCILDKRSDPREGETTTRMTNIKREEPDASLFQVPKDYRVVDERGPFQIVFVRPRQAGAAK
ncbi:MAG TPA: hypothetical protein VMU19_05645 [Bryobacteraceae bacterium]|nr:hypothetical protein [Bryobacteraceae bacterium]